MKRTPRQSGALALTCLFALALACDAAAPPAERAAPVDPAWPPSDPPARQLLPPPAPPALAVALRSASGADPGEALRVVVARPQGQAQPSEEIAITFSKPVVGMEAQAAGAGADGVARIEPAVAGAWRWLGSSSLEFVPDAPLPLATPFQVTVPAGLTALDGSALEAPLAYTFETPAPSLLSTDPEGGFAWLDARPAISLVFDQPVRDLARHAHLRAGGTRIPLAIEREVSLADEARARLKAQGPSPYPHPDDLRRLKSRHWRYELRAAADLPLGADVSLEIDGALAGAEGPLAIARPTSIPFRTHGTFAIRGAGACRAERAGDGDTCSFGPLAISATNPIDLASLRDRLSIEPEVEIDWPAAAHFSPSPWMNRRDPWAEIRGNFRPGTAYRVRIAAGLADRFGQRAAAFEATVRFDDRPPYHSLGDENALLEAAGDGALPITSLNVEEIALNAWQLSDAEFARQVSWRPWQGEPRPPLGSAPRQISLDLSGPRNVQRETPLKLREIFPEAGRTGFFLVEEALDDRPQWRGERVLVQITDLAVHLKLGARDGLMWVTSLSAGLPVAGADVCLLAADGRALWRGQTDADGMAATPGWAELHSEPVEAWSAPPLIAIAEKDGDRSATASDWTGAFGAYSFGLEQGALAGSPERAGLVFTDRGVYRPGDPVHFKGVVRYRQLDVLARPAPGQLVEVEVRGPDGKPILQEARALSEFGTFSGNFQLDTELPLGLYDITAALEVSGQTLRYSGEFRVEEYRAPQFQVDVALPAAHFTAGDALTAAVQGRYLYGGAMSRAEVSWTAQRSTADFVPPGNAGFAFGNQAWGWNDGPPASSSELAGGGKGVLDDSGLFHIDAGALQAPAGRTWTYVVEAAVADVNRQRVASRAELTVHPAGAYAGVRTASGGFAEAGKPIDLDMIAVSPEGVRLSGQPLSLVVKRRTWQSIQRQAVGGQWITASEPVETQQFACQVTSAATPATCTFSPEDPGYHLAEVTVTDAQGRQQTTRSAFHVIGPGWVSWQRGDADLIDLVADKQLYSVGDTAQILVKSPYPEAEAILTVEREGILSARRIALRGSATALSIPIDEALVPNAYVGLVLVRGRTEGREAIEAGADPGRPAVRMGYAELRVEKKGKRLQVEVTPDAPERRPRERVEIDIQVTNAQGEGQPAEVTVWAVDEGVLRLTDYQPPDLVEAMHPRRALSVWNAEPLIHLVLARLYGDKGAGAGGSGGRDASGAGFRSKFLTTPLFATAVTDARGKATVSFELPDNLTAYRIMAVAATAGDLFGTGASLVTASKPLLALPALPRFALSGDRLEAGVVLHRNLPGEALVTVTAEAEGIAIEGAARRQIRLAQGAPQEVRFRLAARAPGLATLRFRAEGDGDGQGAALSDAVEQRLPVHLAVQREAVAVYGETEGARTEALALPEGARADLGGLELTLAATALGGFDAGMRQLVEYPYGCAEQLSARLIPFIALRELYGTFGAGGQGQPAIDWIGAEALAQRGGADDPDAVVRQTLAQLEQLQLHDGSFRYWPSSARGSPEASIFATLALGRAAEVGYPVSAEVLQRAQRYLSGSIAAGKAQVCQWTCAPVSDETRVFALYALARTGAPKASYHGALFDKRGALSLEAKAMLADAIARSTGSGAMTDALLGELFNHARETPGEVHFEDQAARDAPWSSAVRTSALALQVLAGLQPDHPYVGKLTRYLMRARQGDGTFRNTQEAAFALMALAEVVRSREREAPDFTARAALGGSAVAEARFQGRAMSVERRAIPMAELDLLDAALPLVMERSGARGRLTYGARLTYYPQERPRAAVDRGLVVQRWFEPYAGGGQATRFGAGELVRVKVRVGTPAERHYVAIEVPLPAGLEAVDTSLASTARLPEVAPPPDDGAMGGDGSAGEGRGLERVEALYGAAFYTPFNHRELRDDRALFFADRLLPGLHTLEFVARATTPGIFVLKPALAEEMYSPEVYGRSEGGTFAVDLASAPIAGH